MTENAERTKHFQRVPVALLTDWQKSSGHSYTEIAEALGVSKSGLAGWVKDGVMPKMAQVAIEGLKRRFVQTKDQPRYYLALVPPEGEEAMKAFCAAVKVTLQKLEL